MRKLQNFVGGAYRDAEDGPSAPLIDPSTGEPFAEAPVSGAADIDHALRVAADAFTSWKRTTPSERSLALIRIADALEARAEDLVRAESENTGKPFQLTMDEEIPPMVDQIRFFAGAARNLQGLAAAEYMAGHTSFVRREPLGVCGAVTPWNYPMMMAVWKFAPALAAGNTMVLKPSDTTPVTALLMAEIMAEHLPPGVFNVVCGDRDTGRALVVHDTPAMVSVTGSVRAGMEVAAPAAPTLKRVHLELGGKAPVIVFDDADPAAAAEGIAGAGYFNAGQDCTAATRVLAGPRVHEELLAALVEQAEGTTVGGTDNEDADYGPLNNANQLERVRGFLERTPSHASVATGGTRWRARLLLRADGRRRPAPGRRDGAVRGVRAGHHGAGIQRRGRGARSGPTGWSTAWLRRCGPATTAGPCAWHATLDFGCVWINTHIPLVAEMPHGGFKRSGYGKDLSAYGFEDYTRIKHVMSNIEA